MKIEHKEAGKPSALASGKFVDRMFLRNGDAVPCRIHSIDESTVNADFPLTDNNRIDRRQLLAVEFGAFATAVSHGLDDPRWVIADKIKTAVERDHDQFIVSDTARIGYANIQDATDIKFHVQWEANATAILQVSLFARTPQDATGTINLLIYRSGGPQVFIQAAQAGVGNVRAVSPRQIVDGGNSFRIRLRHKKIAVYEGDTLALEIPCSPSTIGGKCLSFHISPLNMNGGAAGRLLGNQKRKLLTISKVEVLSTGGGLLEMLVDADERDRLLTVPRFRQHTPPTEILVGRNGDLLRGRLVALDEHHATFQSRLDQLAIPRDRLSGIIWPSSSDEPAPDAATQEKLARIVFRDSTVMRMSADQLVDEAIVGRHPALGDISVPLALVKQLQWGVDSDAEATTQFADWKLHEAQQPQLETADGSSTGNDAQPGIDSPLVGQAAPAFKAEVLESDPLRIPDPRGRTVVLDFWATWCGPCVKSMPQTMSTVAEFPPEKVALVAVNQLESPDAIEQFLKARGWHVSVALDRSGDIGQLFHVDAIPQLVVISPDGKIARLFVGDRPQTQEQLKAILQELTGDSPPAPAKTE